MWLKACIPSQQEHDYLVVLPIQSILKRSLSSLIHRLQIRSLQEKIVHDWRMVTLDGSEQR